MGEILSQNLSLQPCLFSLDWIRASGAEIEQQLGESGSYASFTQTESMRIIWIWFDFEVAWRMYNGTSKVLTK